MRNLEHSHVLSRRMKRGAVVATGAALVSLLAVGCSGSAGNTASSSTTSVAATATSEATIGSTPAAAGTTATTATPSSVPPGSTSTTVADPNCGFGQLKVSAGPGQGATGHISAVLVFTNTSAEQCQLTGYPGVAGVDASGTQQVQATRTLNGFMGGIPNGTKPPVVTLAAGQSASATVEGTNVPTDSQPTCPTYPALLVTPPNATQSVTITAELPGCSPLQVHPVVAGTTGSIPN